MSDNARICKIEKLVTGIIRTNTYFVECGNDFFVVDPGGDSEKIIEYINRIGKYPVLCVLTHAHPDHVGALKDLKIAFPKMKIAAHKLEAHLYGENSYQEQVTEIPELSPIILHSDLPPLDYLLTDGCKLPLIETDWKIIHTPGHTKGSICIYNENEKILFSGDTVFESGYGRTDLFGGSNSEMMKSLQRLTSILNNCILYPGH